MRKYYIVLFLFLHLFANAQNTYYVAPNGGSDSYTGLDSIYISGINGPWATWQKAFDTAIAGDTVYFRGGVWYLQQGQTVDLVNKDGTTTQVWTVTVTTASAPPGPGTGKSTTYGNRWAVSLIFGETYIKQTR